MLFQKLNETAGFDANQPEKEVGWVLTCADFPLLLPTSFYFFFKIDNWMMQQQEEAAKDLVKDSGGKVVTAMTSTF